MTTENHQVLQCWKPCQNKNKDFILKIIAKNQTQWYTIIREYYVLRNRVLRFKFRKKILIGMKLKFL